MELKVDIPLGGMLRTVTTAKPTRTKYQAFEKKVFFTGRQRHRMAACLYFTGVN
jgi:hypothetical protein